MHPDIFIPYIQSGTSIHQTNLFRGVSHTWPFTSHAQNLQNFRNFLSFGKGVADQRHFYFMDLYGIVIKNLTVTMVLTLPVAQMLS